MTKKIEAKTTPRIPKCIFCGQTAAQTSHMLACGNKYLCKECFDECREVMDNICINETRAKRTPNLLTPRKICAELDRHIVGQELAKRQIATAVYHHQQCINDKSGQIKKSNILMVGPTGSGKTLIAQTLAHILDVPFVIADATRYTKVGYVGEDVEQMLARLVELADGDIEKAQRGIIYIDEIDKISRKGGDSIGVSVDPSGEGVQQSLLKLIEGTEAQVQISNGYGIRSYTFDTRNVLFICGGAFAGLLDEKRKEQKKKAIGFSVGAEMFSTKDLMVTTEDLKKYGLIPELLGRLPIIATLEELTEDDLIRILTEPQNAIIKEYKAMMECDGVKLTFSSDALREVAHESIMRGTGARGLKSILENALLDLMYNAPDAENLIEYQVTASDIVHGCHISVRNEIFDRGAKAITQN